MMSLLAVPDGKLSWGVSANSGNTWISKAPPFLQTIIAVLVVLSVVYLRRTRTFTKNKNEQPKTKEPKKPESEDPMAFVSLTPWFTRYTVNCIFT
jgi:hypothetical protein